jgi:acetyl esterase
VPIHPAISSKFFLLEGMESFQAALADPVQRARLDEFMSITGAPPPPAVTTYDAAAPGPHGPVPVRVYLPADDSPSRPGVVWLHGGAFMGGDLDMPEADWTARQLCDRAGAVVVSIDYRLAVGGVTYPVPHDDVVAAVRWVRDTAAELAVDAARISVGGASAGGNLAAGATLRLRDDDGWQPAGLLLAYPVAHPVLPPPSAALAAKMADVPALLRFPPEQTASITTNYLGGPLSTADGYAMPGLAVLDGLCPTLVLNAEYDDLRASGEAFAAQLALAGVDIRQLMAPGTLHGFLNMRSDIEPVARALDVMVEVVARPHTPVTVAA